jgi:hypothetical protein
MGHCPNLLVESCGLDASCCRHSRCPCHRKTRRCWTRRVRGRYASMIALAFEFVLLGMQGLLVVAGIVSALRARLWGALAPTLAIGALVAYQGLPIPRVVIWAPPVALALAVFGMILVRAKAAAERDPDVAAEIRTKSSALLALACVNGAVLVILLIGAWLVRDL